MLSTLIRSVIVLILISCICNPLNSQERKAVGLHEVVVYKPGQHDRGLPKVLFEKIQADQNAKGRGHVEVAIPPAVHVHRYYYSGDKEIQGPIVSSGPTIVVAKHPHTNEQMYVDVTLPSGAPIIAYNKKGITYVYKDQRVSIRFRKFPHDPNQAVVQYHSGRGMNRRFHEGVATHLANARQHWQKSSGREAIMSAGQKTRDLVCNVSQGTCSLVKQLHDSTKAAISVIPGVTPLLNPSNDTATQKYRNQAQAATNKANRLSPKFVPTNR